MVRQDLREAGKAIRMIVCDMDGTLLNSEKQISPGNRQAINRAREKGIYLSICSGRIPAMLPAYSLDLDIKGPLIAANGASVIDVQSETVHYQKPIERSACQALIDFAAPAELDLCILTDQGGWFSENSQRVQAFILYNEIAQKSGFSPIPLTYFAHGTQPELGGNILKILVYEIHPGDMALARTFLDDCPTLDYTSSDEGLLDICAPGVSKGNGLLRMMDLLGFSKEQVCVFGDFENDISMLKEAGLSFAMGNGTEGAKAAAMVETLSNDQDGVAAAIETYIL